jgi:hypothetical protein
VSESTIKGAIAEAAITAPAIELGLVVLRPLVEDRRYDLIIDTGPELLRVQCKWAPRRGSVVAVHLIPCRHTPAGYLRSTYGPDEVDGFGVSCQELRRCFYVPIAHAAGRTGMHLRLRPAANNQRTAINFAADYDFGAIAQLGERRHGMAEAGGSSPPSSTSNVRPLR